jgi:hypothetical protein
MVRAYQVWDPTRTGNRNRSLFQIKARWPVGWVWIGTIRSLLGARRDGGAANGDRS